MEKALISNSIRIAYIDAAVNRQLAAIPAAARNGAFSIHFNQDEDLFLELGSDFVSPSFPIHHDVRIDTPEEIYMEALRPLIASLSSQLPGLFQGLTYFFDPSDNLKPSFFRLYKVEDSIYAYLLRLDLSYRPFESELAAAGTNDITASYRTRRLYIESEIVPLEEVVWQDGRAAALVVRQLISNTWIGETGRGYLIHGIWMDAGLSKFFSKVVLGAGSHTYPFYPFFCKYKTICASIPFPSAEYRRMVLPLLHRLVGFLGPQMGQIQNSLKQSDFSETMPLFVELARRVPESWRRVFAGYRSEAYLNSRDIKEFTLAAPDSRQ